MFYRLKEPFGKAGLVVAVVALVAALVGGAYAATGLNPKQEKEVKKIARKFAGKPGAAGPAGPAGAPGQNGTNGKDGAPGAAGAKGATGSAGAAGATGATGAAGVTGATGQTGFTETLPIGKTETGAWTFGIQPEGTSNEIDIPISFPIPLPAEIGEANVHFMELNGGVWKEVRLSETTFEPEFVAQAACPGSAASPKANSGHLCVYTSGLVNALMVTNFTGIRKAANPSEGGASTGGAVLNVFEVTKNARGFGTFAVTP